MSSYKWEIDIETISSQSELKDDEVSRRFVEEVLEELRKYGASKKRGEL